MTSPPYVTVPLREGTTTITKPARVVIGPYCVVTRDHAVTFRLADVQIFPVPARSIFTGPTDAFHLATPFDITITGPAAGSLILFTDEDAEMTWRATTAENDRR